MRESPYVAAADAAYKLAAASHNAAGQELLTACYKAADHPHAELLTRAFGLQALVKGATQHRPSLPELLATLHTQLEPTFATMLMISIVIAEEEVIVMIVIAMMFMITVMLKPSVSYKQGRPHFRFMCQSNCPAAEFC